jgi:hypothetical protein
LSVIGRGGAYSDKRGVRVWGAGRSEVAGATNNDIIKKDSVRLEHEAVGRWGAFHKGVELDVGKADLQVSKNTEV